MFVRQRRIDKISSRVLYQTASTYQNEILYLIRFNEKIHTFTNTFTALGFYITIFNSDNDRRFFEYIANNIRRHLA